MSVVQHARDRVTQIIGISPLERPDPGLVAAICHANALGVLDLGRDREAAKRALAMLARTTSEFGVRIPDGVVTFDERSLPVQATVVISSDPASVRRFATRTVLVEVTSLDEARTAVAAGATGLVAKGCEAGGRIGDETTFVLVQHLVAQLGVAVWARGGIGLYTAAACMAGGASGIVLDTQLALVRESSLPALIQAAIGAMDGSETTILAGHRVYTRPDLPVASITGASLGDVHAKLGGDDIAANLMPLGQDAAFAKSLAQQFATAGQLCRGLRAAIESQISAAVELAPLAPHSPFAQAHNIKYPVAQGPMSRVSDRARFAEAVAVAGGLPFLALTLMSGPEVRELLRETQSLVGDRPWGVGILGFVPPEIREQQLAVLREIAPPVALIAGGRPSQATPLEAQGTATYLHVPSPGLLDLFLRDGARKFVFEGSECGGHVGPRTSLVLWEQQIARLLAHEDPSELSVLFAGGIHDARSAAMVAAMAAPLAARGAKVGVLMGTAYLFTHEAVAAGAIQPGFQQAALACERTVLLETSPGHSTRCADTEYAEAFAREKARLEAAGVGVKDMWAQLEQLNLGRLRIAAKGLRRDGDAIVNVDADAQQRDGMYMIGQVAALRRELCSVLELHRSVSLGYAPLLEDAAARVAQPEEGDADSRGTDVALIGIAAIFPGAPDTDAFWTNIVTGKNAVREVPPERWSIDAYYDPAATGANANVGKKTPCKWGGFLDEVAFDPLAYGIPPKSLSAIEPVQLLSLEIARRAIADAGYADRAFERERTAVIFGAEAGTDLSSAYSFRALFPHYVGGPLPAGLDAELPTLSEDSFPGVLSNVIAGRIANRLDLGGVNYTVDAACAASLAAMDLAVKELVSGSSDMVLCGGADLHNSINDYLLFSSVHALSPTGQCHTFDADADGIVLGEGVACVVLKRLADAERDGDRIYCVIKGVAGASDGKSLGLTAPRKDGQVRALDRAYRQAGVSPADVGLVEAHGTGTIVGDRTELATLTDVFTKAGAAHGACVLGSVKSQIGHTKCAAGMAGLIKAALAIHHGVLPPTLNIKKPNPAWDKEKSPFVFLDTARPWTAEHRVAAVSAFGFGGTNFHAVLTSHRGTETAHQAAWPAELFLFRGADRATAVAAIDRVLSRLDDSSRLRDLARSVCSAGHGAVQIAIVAESVEDLRARLAQAKDGKADKRGVFIAGAAPAGKLAFLCPGQGSQRPGMLADLFIAFPQLHKWLELGAQWTPKLFPPAAFTREDKAAQAEAITDTRVAQPTLGIADMAVAELLQSLGIKPDMAAGHSYGELAALCIAGALGPADLLELSAARGEAIVAAAGGGDPGTMAAVAGDAAAVAPVIAGVDGVVIANHNSKKQCVLSGSTSGIEMALVLVAAAGFTARRIPVACAFHSPIVAGARTELAARLAEMPVASPKIPVFANVTAEPYPTAPDGVRELLAAQVANPVRFADEIEAMYAAGARTFVETGPGQVLTRLVGEILGDRPHTAVATDGGDAGLRQLLRALATLAVIGIEIDADPLFWARDAAIIELETARPKKSAQTWLVNGHTARPIGSPPPPPASAKTPISLVPAAQAAIPAPVAAVGERDGVVLEFLRNMRSMITAQRDVMLSYLGSVPAPQVDVIDQPRLAARPVIEVVEAPAPMAAAAAPEAIDPMQLVVSIVSERTGYPAETLGIDLDLEADLSIDSIKRIEIIGELAQRLGLRVQSGGAEADAIVEELATRKTLRALVEWLSARLAQASTAAPAEIRGPANQSGKMIDDAKTTKVEQAAPASAVGRYRLAIVDAPPPINGHSTFAGQAFAIAASAAGRDLADGVAAKLTAEGAKVQRITGERIGEVFGYVEVVTAGDALRMPETFERVRDAVLGGAQTICLVTLCGNMGRGANAYGGPAGLVKVIAAEFPTIKVRVVDVDPVVNAGTNAALIHAELHAADHHVEIGYRGGARSTLEVAAAEPPAAGTVPLDASSVVLVTGGARGITAFAALALAKTYGCKIELVGRSPLPEAEAGDVASAGDARALRGLFARQVATPAEIEQLVTRTLAAREIRATLAALGDRGTYHSCDVRSPAFAALIDDIYARHGRLDAVIHGAGVLEDKLIRQKTTESFERVFTTKLAGARTLVDKLRGDVKLVVMFSSISGAFGNRGQVDYATAGDALDKLAWALQHKIAGRVISIDWGPWAGAGMVSPDLEREYARRGISLIDPQRGIAALLGEVAAPRGEAQIVLSATDPRTFARVRTAGQAEPAVVASLEV